MEYLILFASIFGALLLFFYLFMIIAVMFKRPFWIPFSFVKTFAKFGKREQCDTFKKEITMLSKRPFLDRHYQQWFDQIRQDGTATNIEVQCLLIQHMEEDIACIDDELERRKLTIDASVYKYVYNVHVIAPHPHNDNFLTYRGSFGSNTRLDNQEEIDGLLKSLADHMHKEEGVYCVPSTMIIKSILLIGEK